MKKLVKAAATLSGIAIMACGSKNEPDVPTARLLGEELYDATAEEKRLREMQAIRIVSRENPDRSESYDISGSSAVAIIHALFGSGSLGFMADAECGFLTTQCDEMSCRQKMNLEFAERLFAVVEGTASVKVKMQLDEPAVVLGENVFQTDD